MNFWKLLYKIDLDITSDLDIHMLLSPSQFWFLGENNMTFKWFYIFLN
jgi:hypothetical protein